MPANETAAPPVMDEAPVPTTRTVTFRAWREQQALPHGSKVRVAADGQSCYVEGPNGPIGGALSVGAIYALAQAYAAKKVVRVVL